MSISTNEKDQYDVSLYCHYNNMSWVECSADFLMIKENTYKINGIHYYNRSIIYPSRDLYIRVKKKPEEKELKLIDIRGYVTQGNTTLNLTFNKKVIGSYFYSFYLYNHTNFYNLTRTIVDHYDFEKITAYFDFTYIPIGSYHLGTFYAGRYYNFSNYYINITNYNYTNSKWRLSNILYSFIGDKSKQKYNLRVPKN